MGIELDRRYQTEAYEQIKSDFEEKNRSCVVLPTGCGKSYLAIKMIEENPNKEILYISPSAVINTQIRERIKDEYGEEAKKIFPHLRFITYNALSKMDTEEFEKINPEMIVLDELHRAGAEIWGKRVNELLEKNNNVKVLGLTATPVRTDGRNMAEEICGGISFELPLTEAVARGILPVPEYICTQYLFEEDIEKVEELVEQLEDEHKKTEYKKKIEEARRHLEKADGIDKILGKHIEKKDGKYIIFCKDIEDINTKEKQIEKWFTQVNNETTISKISSANEREENANELKFFKTNKDNTLKLALAVNMLNEGYHDEELTGILMTRQTMSEILFRQQLGRALSRNSKETPQIFDLVNNIRYFENFRREIKEIIEQGLTEKNREQGEKRGYNRDILDKFKVVEEQIDFIEEFKQIEENLNEYINGQTAIAKLIDILEKIQQEGIDVSKLKQIKRINGKNTSTILSDVLSNEQLERLELNGQYKIGQQITTAKKAYKGREAYKITEDEKRKLEELGIIDLEEKQTAIAKLIDILEKIQQEGIDVSKLEQIKKINGKQFYTTLSDILSNEQLEKLELDGEYKIGRQIKTAKKAYKGREAYKITEDEKRKLEKLGIMQQTAAAKFIEILEQIQQEGIEVSKLKQIKKISGKSISVTLSDILSNEQLEKLGLDGEYKIGQQISNVKSAYNGRGEYAITEDEKRKLEKLGIINLEEKQTAIAKLIDILEKIQQEGIEVSKLKQIKKISGKSISVTLSDILSNEQLEKLGLDGEYKIGQQISNVKSAYKGIGSYKITEDEKRKLEKLGIMQQTAIAKLIEISERIQQEGIDLSKLKARRRINGKDISTILLDILSSEQLEKLGLDGEYKIGQQIQIAREAYKGCGTSAITEDEKGKLEKLGIINLEEKQTAIAKLIEISERIQQEGIDLSKLKARRRINGKDISTILLDILSSEQLEKLGLDGEYKIGQQIQIAREAYKGCGTSAITELEKKQLEDLGIITELSKKDAEQQRLVEFRDSARELYESTKMMMEKEQGVNSNEDK